MNLNSITTKISIVFLFAISILIALFFFYLDYEKKQKHIQVQNYHENISNYLKSKRMPRHEVKEYLETLSFKLAKEPFEVIPNSEFIYSKRGFEILEYENSYYLHIITPFFKILFKDLSSYKYTSYSYVFFLILFLFLVFIYVWLIKSLQPLKELKSNITSFSNGDLSINCKSNKTDEIAEVSNEFDKAVRKIELLLSSRQLFLRTVMHELKTPIAKGRIVSELINDEKQKNRMIEIFERLDFLINDFSKVEQIVSQNYDVIKQKYKLDGILVESLNSLMLEDINSKVNIEINSNTKLEVDIELMSMVFKNLIDNALRYSSNGKIEIKEEEGKILFISQGEKLKKELSEYFKPFHNDTKSKSHGMGLGLYIVKSILNIHGFNFDYEHKDGNNIFKIIYSK